MSKYVTVKPDGTFVGPVRKGPVPELGGMKTFNTAKVIKHGGTLIVPETMTYPQAAELCLKKAEEEEALTEFQEFIPGFVLDAAYAWHKAAEAVLGLSITKVVHTMFGPVYPKFISVPIGPNPDDKVQVTWGQTVFPFAESNKEVLNTGVGMQDGRATFRAGGVIRKKHQDVVSKIANEARRLVKEESIYKNKAIRVSFTDQAGEQVEMLAPTFIDMTAVNVNDIIYSKEIEKIIERYVMTPLLYTQECRDAKIPLKRGILAAGPYGTGKTILAQAVGKVGTEHGWTFIYIRNASELPDAIRFATLYQPCIIFAEDLDRAVQGEERTEEIDAILNTLDGIDAKSQEIMVILTTNHLDQVNQAMRRPGRLDIVINVTPPDAEAVERLVRSYGRGLVAENTNLKELAGMLAGQSPAVVREVIERAKLASLGRTGDPKAIIVEEDLIVSAQLMLQQLALLKPVAAVDTVSLDSRFRKVIGDETEIRVGDRIKWLENAIEQIAGAVGAEIK